MGSMLSPEEQKTVECDSYKYKGHEFVPSNTQQDSSTNSLTSSGSPLGITSRSSPPATPHHERRGLSPTHRLPSSPEASLGHGSPSRVSPPGSLLPSRPPSPLHSPPALPGILSSSIATGGSQRTLTRDGLPSADDVPPPPPRQRGLSNSGEIGEDGARSHSPLEEEAQSQVNGETIQSEDEGDRTRTIRTPLPRKTRKRAGDRTGAEAPAMQNEGPSSKRRKKNSEQAIKTTQLPTLPAREPTVLPPWFKNSQELFRKLSALHLLWDELTGK